MEDQDFVYERNIVDEVKVEEVTGGSRYKGKVWREIAMQIYCENGRNGYREVGHYRTGAPFLYGSDRRISISHTDGCLVVATLRVPQGTDLAVFSEPAALGIDVERADREQIMKVRERFLTETELELVKAESVEANILAWTAKEAMLKATMNPAIDFRNDITIVSLPGIVKPLSMQTGKTRETLRCLGLGTVKVNGEEVTLALRHYRTGPFVVTVARPTLSWYDYEPKPNPGD